MENKKSKPALVFAILAIGLSIYISKTGVDTYSSIWSLFPPVVAIFIALFTKEVFSSLFLGITIGAILGSKGSVAKFLDNIVSKGFIESISQTSGIYIFLVVINS